MAKVTVLLGADPGINDGGQTMASAERETITSLGQTGIWKQSTKWDAGEELSVGSGEKPTKPFVYFHTKESQKWRI